MIKILGFIILSLLLMSSSVVAMTEQQQLEGLKNVKALDAAYPIALKIANQNGSYEAWRKVAAEYADFDLSGLAYLKAFQQVEKNHREDQYRDFVTLRPQTTLSALAVHRIFQGIDAHPDAETYARFANSYQDYAESLVARHRLQALVYAQVIASQKLEGYDRFVVTFPEAEQVNEAQETAYQLERAALIKDFAGADPEHRSQIATLLLNQALDDDKAGENKDLAYRRLSALRKFRLLHDLPEFKDVLARSVPLTIEINMRRFDTLKTLVKEEQTQTRELIEKTRVELLKTVTAQYSQLHEQIVTEDLTLQAALEAHQQALDLQLNLINKNLGQLDGKLEDVQQRLLDAKNQPGCKSGIACWFLIALDVMPNGNFKFGVSLIDKLPALIHYLKS